METNTTVQVTTNTNSLLQTLRFAFTNHDTVVQELMQNARRAGATCIHIAYEGDVLAISDDGHGIRDFMKLLQVGTSDWKEDVMETEGPYGIGFLSAIYAAKVIDVASNGQRLVANTEDLLAGIEVGLRRAGTDGRTIVTLIGFQWKDAIHRVKTMAEGFPLPVFFNGEELPAPCRAGREGEWISTPVGLVRLGRSARSRMRCFLQGFNVTEGWGERKTDTVVHLDTTKFKGRLPDRTRLVDQDEALKSIQAVVTQLWKDKVIADAKTMTPAEFVEAHSYNVSDLGIEEVFNDLDFLPVSYFQAIEHCHSTISENYLLAYSDGTSQLPFVTRDQIASGQFKVAAFDWHNFELDDGPLPEAWTAAHLMNASLLVRELDEKHWVFDHVSIDDDSTVSLELKGKRFVDTFKGYGSEYMPWFVAEVADAAVLSVTNGDAGPTWTQELANTVVVYKGGEGNESKLLFLTADTNRVPGASQNCMAQLSDYMHKDESKSDEADSDADIVNHWIRGRLATSIEQLVALELEHALEWVRALYGHRIDFTLDAMGKVTVHAVTPVPVMAEAA